ncbi:hypothetical protein RC74_19135 [Falsihalocynthiibacter arcticus]|uniref:Uncharacterized protein n=1 Tax=Falsihalocynthiibacter arcticus TaxID=1579316 RepID=A0A126V446_9RHOB|nr:hypothetical protein RC74_19135 [Falsihalocynthiibacter arcticus]
MGIHHQGSDRYLRYYATTPESEARVKFGWFARSFCSLLVKVITQFTRQSLNRFDKSSIHTFGGHVSTFDPDEESGPMSVAM